MTLDTQTLATLRTALDASADAGVNAQLRDVHVRGTGLPCSDPAALGSVIRDAAGGSCWQHVHPRTGNVYDFTTWVDTHPGGAAAIRSFAGDDTLRFPSGHAMSRWSLHERGFPLLGRLGDAVDFAQLPYSVQSESVRW